ncbi:MAG: M28 family peptidase, partial [Chloroflexi bacterium]|nr:M28 family peptidase [Chloroflexota bacterium]
LTAHHDTQYNSPGAVDNASGVQALVVLAERFARQRPLLTLRFAVFGAEETIMLGSKHRAQLLQETGTLSDILAVINLDMLACNAPTWINLTQDALEFRVRVARAFERHGVFDRYGDVHWETPPWPTSDHAPFAALGKPTLFISYRGQQYPHLHLPTDTVDQVDHGLMQLSVDFLYDIIADLANERS